MFGTAKETHQQSPGILLSASSLLLPHQPCHVLDSRRLAGSADAYRSSDRYYHYLSYLEAQA